MNHVDDDLPWSLDRGFGRRHRRRRILRGDRLARKVHGSHGREDPGQSEGASDPPDGGSANQTISPISNGWPGSLVHQPSPPPSSPPPGGGVGGLGAAVGGVRWAGGGDHTARGGSMT